MTPLTQAGLLCSGFTATSALGFSYANKKGYLSLPEEDQKREVSTIKAFASLSFFFFRIYNVFATTMQSVVYDFAIAMGMYAIIRWSAQDQDQMNFSRENVYKGCIVGLADFSAGMALMLITEIAMHLSSKNSDLFDDEDDFDMEMEFDLFDAYKSAIAAPITEELTFRGTLQPWFENFLSKKVAMVATSIIFGLVHLTPDMDFLEGSLKVFSCTVGGYIYSVLRENTNSLTTPIAAHIINNSLCVALDFFDIG